MCLYMYTHIFIRVLVHKYYICINMYTYSFFLSLVHTYICTYIYAEKRENIKTNKIQAIAEFPKLFLIHKNCMYLLCAIYFEICIDHRMAKSS